MSKGRRKSDPRALRIAGLRVQQWKADTNLQYCFTAEDRPVLQQICRLDLISIIEEDLGLGPLKSSQKNSVACMINFLLAQQRQARLSRPQGQDLGLLHAVSALGATGGHDSGSLDQQGPGSSQTAAAAAAGADGWSPSSADGSCPTPSTAPDEQPQQLPAHALDAAALAADVYSQPWLAELHEQLEAAGTMRCRIGDVTTDTDEDTTGTEADSGWMGARPGLDAVAQQDQQQLHGAGSAQALAPALDTSYIEDMLVQQLLLDMSSEVGPRRRAHKSSSFSRPQPGEQEDQRQPPLLLQQKLQQLEEQQQQLKEQQMHQELRRQRVMQQQRELEREMQAQAAFDQMLHEELLNQLRKADPSQLLRQSVVAGSGFCSQQLPAAAPAAPDCFAGPRQLPGQAASWPLLMTPGASPGSPTAQALAAAPADAMLGAGGLLLQGLSDASLPQARQGPRLSLEGGGSFTRKREKMLMDLPTLQDEAQTDGGDDSKLCVKPSGPSAEPATKRMSITLPGCTQVAALPTSFSGRVAAGPTGMARPQAADLQQDLMQLSSCEDPLDMLWQQQQQQQPSHLQDPQVQQLQQYQHQSKQQQLMPVMQLAGSAAPSLASRLKTMVRGNTAQARRYASIGTGGSFGSGGAAAAAPPASLIHSADAAPAHRAVTTAGSGQLEQWSQPQFAGQQMGMGFAPGTWGPQPASGGLMEPDVLPPAATNGRLWHSMAITGVSRDVNDPNFAPVGAFSWHAERSTMLAGMLMPGQAATGQHMYGPSYPAPTMLPAAAPAGAAAGNSQFAQQLAQLRAEFEVHQQQEQQQQQPQQLGGFGMVMQDMTVLAQAPAAAGMGGNDFAGPSFREGAASGLVAGGMRAPGCSSDRPGLMGKLVRALKVGSRSAHSMPLQGPSSMGMHMRKDDDLFVTGRRDEELDLARAALQWLDDSGPLNPEAFEAALQSFGDGSSRPGCGMD